MFLKNYHFIFTLFLFSGTIIAISSNTWLIRWIGLEINLIRIIPLILYKLNFNATESAIKYFIPQALASILIIFCSMLEYFQINNFQSINIISLIICLALAIKSGMAPFHFWFPQVIIYLEWFICAIILTWQKIAPFILMTFFNFNNFFLLILIFSRIVGALGGLNQLNTKLILTYSSISHRSWILLSSIWCLKLWLFYFFIYRLISLSLIKSFYLKNITYVKDMYLNNFSNLEKYFFVFNILRLGGLPPFLGFLAKLTVIITSLNFTPIIILITIVIRSLVSIFYYLKLFYNLIINRDIFYKFIIINKKNNLKINFLIIFSILRNIFIPILVFLT